MLTWSYIPKQNPQSRYPAEEYVDTLVENLPIKPATNPAGQLITIGRRSAQPSRFVEDYDVDDSDEITDDRDAESLYRLLESEVAPMFYLLDIDGLLLEGMPK